MNKSDKKMKKSALSVLFFVWLSAAEAVAWSYGEFVSCDAINPKPKITFLTSYGLLIHDLSTPQREIERISGGAEKGFYVVGLATLTPKYQIHIKDIYVKTLDQNHTCLLPSEIEIKFGYNDPLIYVSKEIDRNSCKFSQVIRHEQVHQRINILTLEYFLPLIDETIRNAINEVRDRAGQPGLPAGLTKDAMRERIKNERRVEFLMEEHRFYDLRRWLDGDVLAQPIMGMKVYDENEDGVLEYVVSQVEERAFTGAHYYLPIPLAEQEKNPLLRDE